MDRMKKIGEIRDAIERLLDAARFEVLKEIMEGYDRYNFGGVPDPVIDRIHRQLAAAEAA